MNLPVPSTRATRLHFLRWIALPAVALTLILAGTPGAYSQQEDEQQLRVPERFAAGDWGVTIDAQDSTRFADHLNQDVRGRAAIVSIWGQRIIPYSQENELRLSAQGSYNWSRSDIYVNLDQLRLTAFMPESFSDFSSLEISAGRFPFQDPSGLVLRHTGDGLLVRVATPRSRVRVGAMYTGLQLNPASNIRMTQTDRAEERDDDETFGPGRVVAMADLRFPELVGRHTLSLTFLGQYDTRDADSTEDTLHSAYGIIGLSGRLVGRLYSDLFGGATYGSYDTGADDDTYLGFMGSARLRLFLPQARASRISLRAVYMSNDDDQDSFDAFIPISRSTPGTVISIPLENIMFGELSYSIRPFVNSESLQARRVQMSATGRTFFTASDDPPRSEPFGGQLDGSVFGLQTEPEGNYIGTEGVVGVNARVRSDFGVGFSFGAFFPGTGSDGVFTSERKTEFLARIELSTRL